jgi:hypothetical protein
LHENDFKSCHVRKSTGRKKYYFSSEYNSNTAEGRATIMEYVSALFDTCSGGIIASGTSTMSAAEIVLRCKCLPRLGKRERKMEVKTQRRAL